MKKCILTLCLLLMAVLSQAVERTSQQAAQLAAQFTNNHTASSKMRMSTSAVPNITLAHTFSYFDKLSNQDKPAVYVFNRGDDHGFVLVSADDQTRDILCYSDEGSFDLATANPDLLWWINRYAKEIANINSTNTYNASKSASASAPALLALPSVQRTSTSTSASTTAINPLLGNIAWDQKTPYWNMCPTDDEGRCQTGCVATAAAQIMRYWKHPARGVGNHSYTWSGQTLSQDFSAITFDWANMRETYSGNYTTTEANAVATLMYACGVACNMDYGNGGSAAYNDDMGYGLMTYFGYKNTAKFVATTDKASYEGYYGKGSSCAMPNSEWEKTTDQLTELFNKELEAGRPILIGGESDNYAHAFVCDGHDADGRFHINWGWSGGGNCYVTLSALKPEGMGTDYDFSSAIEAIIGLEPEIVAATGVTVSPATASINIDGTQQLTATVLPENASNISVTWSSSDETVATVSTSGLVKGINAGTATITATTVDGGFTATSTITVNADVDPSNAFALVTDASNLEVGDSVIIVNRTANMAMSTTQNSRNRGAVSVTISNNTVASGLADVQVFALKAGTTSGSWAFYAGDKGYIYDAGNNMMGTTTDTSKSYCFTVSISDGNATIKSVGGSRTISTNNDGSVFSCYSSASNPVSIFIRKHGDLSSDGKIAVDDAAWIIRKLKHSSGTVTDKVYDINNDGSVNKADIDALIRKALK